MPKTLLTILNILLLGGTVCAQSNLKVLTDSLLEHNYGIRLERIRAKQAEVRNSIGASGALPALTFQGLQQNSWNNTRQVFFSGDVREANSAANNSLNFGLRMDWTLFQGFRVLATKRLLEAQEEVGQAQLNYQIEDQVQQLATLYFRCQYLHALIKSQEESVKVSSEQVELAQQRLRLGKGNKMQLLQARNNLHADSSLLMQQQFMLKQAVSGLNLLLNLSPERERAISDSIRPYAMEVYIGLKNKTLSSNTQLLLSRLNMRVAEANLQQAKSGYYPGLGFFGAYNFVQSKSQVGILQSNQSLGPSVGLSLNYNLFQGFTLRRTNDLAKLEVEHSRLNDEKVKAEVEQTLYINYQDYLLQRQLLAFEISNAELAKENLDLAEKRLALGVITLFDFRQLQEAYTAAQTRAIEAQYRLKLTELSLKRLTGEILPYVLAH